MTDWKRITWHIFHTISLNYNNEYRNEYINFFESLKTIIPCDICKEHYIQNINKENMKIENNINNDKIFNWTIDLHNTVNKIHNKKIWKYDESKNYYLKNNFNNNILKHFIFEYVRSNFKKNPHRTNELIRMMNSLPYIYPYLNKRIKLIDFKEKFELNRESMQKWLLAFCIIINSK